MLPSFVTPLPSPPFIRNTTSSSLLPLHQFHHDGDYCWAGKSGTVAAIQSYPPVGHVVEFNWGGGWYEAEFLKMALDADGDEICHLLDAKTSDTHQIQFRENDLDDTW